jgi:hypothetical protein
MLGIHTAYDKERLEKLSRMFDGDPRHGNMALYVREHFDLKRICERCGKRTTASRLAVASVIIEGSSWVLPISLAHDGRVLIDLQESISDQSNFLTEQITGELLELGITLTENGVEYVIPVMPGSDAHHQDAQEHFSCRVLTDASPEDVLKWNAEIEALQRNQKPNLRPVTPEMVGEDWKAYITAVTGELTYAYNVQTQYFQWLAEHGQLVLARMSDEHDRTVGIAYCVPEQYQLCLIKTKWSPAVPYQKSAVANGLVFTLIDHIHEKGLATPLNLGPRLENYMDSCHTVPVVKHQLEITNRVARLAILDCFGGR